MTLSPAKPTPTGRFFYAETHINRVKSADKLLRFFRQHYANGQQRCTTPQRPSMRQGAAAANMHRNTYSALIAEPIILAEIELYETEGLHRPLNYYERLVLHQALQGDVQAQREFRQLLNGLRKQIVDHTKTTEPPLWERQMAAFWAEIETSKSESAP